MNEEQKNKAKKELKKLGIKLLGTVICLIILVIGCIIVFKMFSNIMQDTVNSIVNDVTSTTSSAGAEVNND